uniref:Membrane protein n=1 Tax=Micrococcus phage Olihed TaxID=3092209 RepID=A0AAU6R5Z6_9CAUD
MTIAGLALILVGLIVGLTVPTETAYNGQWLLGGIIAAVGLALVWRHRKE